MKKKSLFLLFLTLGLAACHSLGNLENATYKRSVEPEEEEAEEITYPQIDLDSYIVPQKGELGSFNLIGPGNDLILESVNTFSWEACENAVTYTLEICSSDQFIKSVESIDYYSRENITSTTFRINSDFAFRDVNYYWRVTAKNDEGTKECNSIFTFFLKAPAVEEVHLSIGEADDWSLHPLGSRADIEIDRSNFFNNDQDSLKISFKEEDTKRGIPESDGWIIVTRSLEKNIYGTDALFFNMYYAGQNASVIIRLVDRDNEYWYTNVQVSTDARQSVILKFSDFVQRTKDVTTANMHFDYERIKYFEVVFERTFGDGVLLISDVKAIKFDNYRHLFIDKLNFLDYSEAQYVNDNYDFETEISEDELTLKYYGSTDGGKEKINGFGFVKLYANQFLLDGDAIKISLKYTGTRGSNILLRLYEEDKDRWSYSIPFASIEADAYHEFVIPLDAFRASYIGGDGKRQLSFILQIQFGLEGENGTGQLSFKGFEMVKVDDYREEDVRIVNEDGLIEDFSSYKYNLELFKIWEHSVNNKDEYMDLYTGSKVIGNDNTVCGQFTYKSDMEAALYYIPVKTDTDFTSLSLWMVDQSKKSGNDAAMYVEDYRPDAILQVRLTTGEIYAYTINSLSRVWHDYNIPFSKFVLSNREDVKGTPKPITSTTITHIGVAFQFFYKNEQTDKPTPFYAPNNPVLIDNIRFSNYEEVRIKAKERYITQPEDVAVVDDFEEYDTQDDALFFWVMEGNQDYRHVDVSDYVSSQGGKRSLSLRYLTNAAYGDVSYFVSPLIDEDVFSKVFKFDMASDAKANVKISIYVIVGSTQQQYTFTLSNVNEEWTEYVVGLTNFKLVNGSTTLSSSMLKNITRISFSASFSGAEEEYKNIYLDNIVLDKTYQSYSVNTRTIIDNKED